MRFYGLLLCSFPLLSSAFLLPSSQIIQQQQQQQLRPHQLQPPLQQQQQQQQQPLPWTKESTTRLYLSSNDIKNGMAIEVDGVPMRVVEFLHVKPGKGSAFVRSKLKNLLTGGNVDKTFRAGEPLDAADVMKSEFQYSYSDSDSHYVMDMESFEVEPVPLNIVSNAEFLVEGMMVNVIKWNDKAIDVELPANYNFVIEYTEEGDKGNTAQGGGSKPATLDCGATLMVPLFIKQGETIKVDLKEKKYLSRVN